MTQEELNRLEKAHNLEYYIDILRKAALIVSNSPIGMMGENEKRRVLFCRFGIGVRQIGGFIRG